jgi:hypothetical protein
MPFGQPHASRNMAHVHKLVTSGIERRTAATAGNGLWALNVPADIQYISERLATA